MSHADDKHEYGLHFVAKQVSLSYQLQDCQQEDTKIVNSDQHIRCSPKE